MENFTSYLKQIWEIATDEDVGKVISLIGTLVSIYVGFTVFDIKKRVLFKSRGPDIAQNLAERANKINSLLLNYDLESSSLIETEIALCLELLKNVKDKLSGTSKATVKAAIYHISMHRRERDKLTRANVREIYTQILMSEQAIKNQIEDTRMEP